MCLNSVTLVMSETIVTTVLVSSSGTVTLNGISPDKFPIITEQLVLFQPSSSFIIAETKSLSLKIQISPIMQVYIVASTSEKGKLSGLCGNYNGVQKDDFKTDSGIIEGTPTSFVNFWKKNPYGCPDVENTFDNPCSLRVETEKLAKDWCSRLTDPNGIFSSCHSEITPDIYYQNCVYDTCKCADIEKCMCAALSAYAHACAARGIILHGWLDSYPCDEVFECSENMEYSYNVTGCSKTCRSNSKTDYICEMSTPVEGCVCSEGTYLNDAGDCVNADQCPCYYNNLLIEPSGLINIDGANCTCTLGKIHCYSPEDCVAPMVYVKCSINEHGKTGTECQRTCQNQDPNNCVSTGCVSGCMCPDNLLADGQGGCVEKENCPCFHNGLTYLPGDEIQDECNTCKCTKGMWNCTDKDCYGTCTIYGEGHYKTFDGRKYFYHGACEYILAQDYCNMGESQYSLRIVTENIPCGSTDSICSKSINVFFGRFKVALSEVDGVKVVETNGTDYQYQINSVGIYKVIEIKKLLNLIWDGKTTLTLQLHPSLKGKVCGLCGNFDGNANNDFVKHDGEVVTDAVVFGNSWKVKPSCPEVDSLKDPCEKNPHRSVWAIKQCSIITSNVFQDCHAHVDSAPYYDACVRDTCACDSGGDCDCFCTAVAAYAAECRKKEACIAWRTPHICPLFCDYYNGPVGDCEWHYRACGSACMKTCKNPEGTCSNQIPLLEGCFPQCPSDRPFLKEETQKCVTEIECAPTCVYDGKEFMIGEEVYHTTDGNGLCFKAVCGSNATIIRYMETCVTTATPFTFQSTKTSTTPTTRQPSTTTQPTTATKTTSLSATTGTPTTQPTTAKQTTGASTTAGPSTETAESTTQVSTTSHTTGLSTTTGPPTTQQTTATQTTGASTTAGPSTETAESTTQVSTTFHTTGVYSRKQG